MYKTKQDHVEKGTRWHCFPNSSFMLKVSIKGSAFHTFLKVTLMAS